LEVIFKPALVEVIMALVTKDGGTLRNLISTKFNRLILTFDNCAVNQRFTGNKYRRKKIAITEPVIISTN